MSATAFASLIISKLASSIGTEGTKYGNDSVTLAQSAIAEAISEYLIANTTVIIQYSGTLTNGSPDPIVTDTLRIAGACTPTSVPQNFNAWVMELQQSIASSFLVSPPGIINAVTTTFLPFSNIAGTLQIPQSSLKSIHESNLNNPQLAVWQIICEDILAWANSESGKNPTIIGVPATRAVSSGTATLTSIIVT